MLKLVYNNEVKQVYTDDKNELIRFLNWWASVKSVQYLGESFVKETFKGNTLYWYSDFFGGYYDYVTQEVIDDFYANKKLRLIEKIHNDVEVIKGAHR